MTLGKEKRGSRHFFGVDRVIFILVISLLIGLFIKNAALASEYVREALTLCVKIVIPSIFPCTVLSALFVSIGGGRLIGELFERPMRFLFGVSGAGASVLFLGWFCGFPVGAVTGAELVRRGELCRTELSRLMLFANIPSPAFVISAVGEGMLNDRSVGFFLYAALLSTAILTGIIQKLIAKKTSTGNFEFSKAVSSFSISAALASSAVSMLNLSANIFFFSVLTKLLLSLIPMPTEISAIFCGIFELSGGCAAAAALKSELALPICAFILGWSGIGVHFQIISACEKLEGLPVYFTAKLLQGLTCAALSLLLGVTL